MISQPQAHTVYDFKTGSDLSGWTVVNDGVMGGLSQGGLVLNDDGHGVFAGQVRLENNGGFSSVRLDTDLLDVRPYSTLVLRLKGDGKRYQLRVRSNPSDYQSYVQYFETNGEWQTLEIALEDLYPTFRGRRLRMPNFPGEQMAELGFLIGNKKAQNFTLILDNILLK